MSLHILTYFQCDVCGGETAGFADVESLLRHISELGWQRRPGEDVCGHCVAKEKEAERGTV